MKASIQTLNAALLSLFLAAALGACNSDSAESQNLAANTPSPPPATQRAPAPRPVAPRPAPVPVCESCGIITRIETMKAKGSGSGMGIVAGAVVGAVVGHQVGSGRGNDAATVAGAIGGGFAGNEIEKQVKSTTYYHVTVAMESGGMRTVDVDALNGISTGSRVRVVGNNLQIVNS